MTGQNHMQYSKFRYTTEANTYFPSHSSQPAYVLFYHWSHWWEVSAKLPNPPSKVEKVVIRTSSVFFPLQFGSFCFFFFNTFFFLIAFILCGIWSHSFPSYQYQNTTHQCSTISLQDPKEENNSAHFLVHCPSSALLKYGNL